MGEPGTIHNVPEEVKNAWPELNSVDPIRRTWLPQYALTLQATAIIIVAVRLWSRLKRMSGGLGFDDALIAAALIFGIILTALFCVGTKFGYDRHVWDMPKEHYVMCAFIGWLCECLFLFSTSLTKISVLLFYRRLSSGIYSRCWKWTIYVAIVFIVAYSVILFLCHLFTCLPPEAYWESLDPYYDKNYRCSSEEILYPVAGALSVFTDFYSVLLPGGLLWRLRISWQKKIALRTIVGLGFLVAVMGIVRTVYFTMVATAPNADVTWIGFDAMVWAQAECQLAMICASAPSLAGFYTHFLRPRIRRMTRTPRNKEPLLWRRLILNFGIGGEFKARHSRSQQTIPPEQASNDHLVGHTSMETPGWGSNRCDPPQRPSRPPAAKTLEGGNHGPPVPSKIGILENPTRKAGRNSGMTMETAHDMV